MGYQVGPQWDLILDQVGARVRQQVAGWLRQLAMIGSRGRIGVQSVTMHPAGYYSAWLSSFSGYGGRACRCLAQWVSRRHEHRSTDPCWRVERSGKTQTLRDPLEKGNQIVYGTPYAHGNSPDGHGGCRPVAEGQRSTRRSIGGDHVGVTNGNFEPGEQDVQDFIDLYNDPSGQCKGRRNVPNASDRWSMALPMRRLLATCLCTRRSAAGPTTDHTEQAQAGRISGLRCAIGRTNKSRPSSNRTAPTKPTRIPCITGTVRPSRMRG